MSAHSTIRARGISSPCTETSATDRDSPEHHHPHRPSFNANNTQDRLREGARLPHRSTMPTNIRRDRKSLFKEVGLLDDDEAGDFGGSSERTVPSPLSNKEFGTIAGISPTSTFDDNDDGDGDRNTASEPGQDAAPAASANTKTVRTVRGGGEGAQQEERRPGGARQLQPSSSENQKVPWYSRLARQGRPRIRAAAASATPPPVATSLSRVTMIAMLIAVVLPAFSYNSGRRTVDIAGADAGVVQGRGGVGDRQRPWSPDVAAELSFLEARQSSPTQVCARWAHHAALLNGTVYIYGGQSKSNPTQQNDKWNNNFLTLDLTKSWDVKTPVLNGLPTPSGPPEVSLGYLWNDYNNLYLYGGQFADDAQGVEVGPSTVWKYSIKSSSWSEDKEPETSDGKYSEPGGQRVQRSAEGAGLSVPELGLSWYFGGHLDMWTTPGWSNQIWRVYLKSLLEFTHPGYSNPAVKSLEDKGAGEFGAYRNITEGGLQKDDAFYERADGALVFIPGWGKKGVLIGLGGGTNTTFSNNLGTLDVYDIETSEWYHQETSGIPPSVRVNLCAVVASAPDASSFQVYVFGGQNLEPYKDQVQYDDMYILTIPAFAWVKVDKQGKNQPSARAGHTCNMRDGQMVTVGGFLGVDSACDSPGIYVFDASRLEWKDKFDAADHRADLSPENSVMAGSYGYKVPQKVADVIGGGPEGSATVTAPVTRATDGPFATGKSPVFTITAGGTVTQTAWGPGATAEGGPGGGGDGTQQHEEDRKPSAGLIAAAVLAGLAGLLAGYLGFCAWLYRRQVRAYRTHLAVANRYSGGNATASHASLGGMAAAFFGRKRSKLGSKDSKGSGGGSQRQQRRWGSSRVPPGQLGVGGEFFGGDDEKPLHGKHSSSAGRESFAWVGRPSQDPARPVLGPWLGPDGSTPGSGTTATGGSPFAYGGSGSGITFEPPSGGSGSGPSRPRTSGSASSTEGLLDGQDMSFFSVVMAPRRALRVVNGLEDGEKEQQVIESK
ncbi:hypothetical protein MCOR11_003120 [Pyricularia oryzae]|nr:hypothetical protein MCOR11_003120 [Pyricularia oryzae]